MVVCVAFLILPQPTCSICLFFFFFYKKGFKDGTLPFSLVLSSSELILIRHMVGTSENKETEES